MCRRVFGGVLCGVFLNRILPELVIVIVLAIVLGDPNPRKP